jgi:polysaccharide export outer membrane protein
MRPLAALIALLGLCSLPSPASGQEPTAPSVVSAPENPLHPGDIVRLRIWREEDLSGEFTVDQDGVVVLPRLGRVEVAGRDPREVREHLRQEYQKFLTHPSIEVVLLRRLQVLGSVRSPGLYPVDATMKVSDALALAGGTTSEGDPDRIELVRNGERIEGRLSIDADLATAQIRSGDQIYVPERSWISRHSGVVAAGLSASAGLLVALLRP